MEQKSFWDLYNDILNEPDKWCYYQDLNDEINSQNLFDGYNALDFIKSVFTRGGKENALNIPHYNDFEITRERANHALSAFLFGVALRDKLHINMQELPKLHSEPTKNFLYFWSLTCLYHDFTTTLETKSKLVDKKETEESFRYISLLSTVEKFMSYFNIEYSLIEDSEEGELIKNYYRYRIEECHAVDHGIASGLLLYDLMMKSYNLLVPKENVKGKKAFYHNGLKYSPNFKHHILLIANTIAKHNMWRADEKDKDVYLSYGLDELIPNDDRTHIVSLNNKDPNVKDKLLFILGLVDTLEPIKCIGREENNNSNNNPYIVLEKMKVYLDNKSKSILIQCPAEYFEDYKRSTESIDKWMDIDVDTPDNFTIRYTIVKEESSEIAA